MLGAACKFMNNTVYHDIIFDGYSIQDNIQVLIFLEKLQSIIHEKYPIVKKIILQSDNGSCFASHQHVKHIHLLNRRRKKLPKVVKWIYSEAGSGKQY
jgi:hypothetical protein